MQHSLRGIPEIYFWLSLDTLIFRGDCSAVCELFPGNILGTGTIAKKVEEKRCRIRH